MPKRSLKRRVHRLAVALERAVMVTRIAVSRLHKKLRKNHRVIQLRSYLRDVAYDVPKHATAIVLIAVMSQWWRVIQSSLPA